ncbi:MAG: OmpA family protein [Flavitalea sp.]
MIRLVQCLMILSLPAQSNAQNLVSNPGFEDENICTEYTKNCAPEAWIATSLYSNYYFDELQMSSEGRHFVGLTAGSIRKDGSRNFIRTRLLCGLRKGSKYRLDFLVRSVHPVLDSIGIFFAPTDFLFEKRSFRDIDPQLWTADAEADDPDRVGWIRCYLEYTASGDEGYITFGHFRRNDISGVRKGDMNTDYYFYLDDIHLVPADPLEQLCPQADSVRQATYEENERHEYLNRKMYTMRKRVAVYQPLPPTVVKAPEPIQIIDTLTIPDIFFATAKYKLLPASFKVLDSFVNKLAEGKVDSIVIGGHTDTVGKLEYNLELSANRAKSVKEYLLSKKPETYIESRGYGYLRPMADNTSPQGRAKNRRVEIILYRRR